jgi:hypothetical protein
MNENGTMTLEECQRAWAASCVEPVIERPDCYHRAGYRIRVTSAEFPALTWVTNWREGCPHWHPGGNAHVRPWCDNRGGRKTRWHACHGCRHKVQA